MKPGARSTQERERYLVSSLVVLMLVLWLGFLFHRSPRFPGSLWGGVLGVSGALLMLWPLTYSLIKRLPAVRTATAGWFPLRTALAWHVYTGIGGALLALLHTGHKFDSVLGILLTVMMFLVVLSGYVGRYLLRLVSQELHEKEALRDQLQRAFQETAAALALQPGPWPAAFTSRGVLARLSGRWRLPGAGSDEPAATLAQRAVLLAESLGDVEHSIGSHDLLKRQFAR